MRPRSFVIILAVAVNALGAADRAEGLPGLPSARRSGSLLPADLRNRPALLVYPTGESEIIVNLPKYDYAWQPGYRFEKMLELNP
jgi:hypothetical protein